MSAQARSKVNKSRRRFLLESARSAGGVALMGLGLGLMSEKAMTLPAEAIRPPGALPERDFLGACIRCGLCVRDCPFDTLRLADVADRGATGTPYFVAREVPCEMCDDIPCVQACPTGALDHALTDIDDARMGLAVLIDQETCIAFHGLRCEVCFNVCPVRGEAITLEMRHNDRSGKHALFIPEVHSDACTGCGKCEKACVMEEAAIKIMPLRLAKGDMGGHYRLGWKEKEAAGESLVAPDLEHRYNLPAGQRYDYEGDGLIFEQGGDQSVPFADDPLSTLNGKGGAQ